ncbi:MAG: hypothetical protein ACI8RD_012394 [Bacillariaceae sp.]|jgi:hypothetical protein
MMMVPVIMNTDGTTTLFGQDIATVPNMMMPQLGSTSSFITPSIANLPQSADTCNASLGTHSFTTNTNATSQPLQQQQNQHQHQPLRQVNLQQPPTSQQQQEPPCQESIASVTTATVPPGPLFIQQMQQQIAMQMQPRYLQHLQQSQGQDQMAIAPGAQGGLQLIAPTLSQTSTSSQQATLTQSIHTQQTQQQPMGGGLQQVQLRSDNNAGGSFVENIASGEDK